MMWTTNTIWFDIAVILFLLLLGHILMGHFEERSPIWRKLLKAAIAIIIVVCLSLFFSRPVVYIVIGLWIIPVVYIHGVLLPKKGINGWTGEPKSLYYDFRGWNKNIFDKGTKEEKLK